MFAVLVPGATEAQEQGISTVHGSESADSLDLAARRVLVWDGPAERWAVLSGDAAVLQGAEGLRGRGAVIRIIEVPMKGGKGYQADVYAEGDVRVVGQAGPPQAEHRAVFRTSKEVRLEPYDPSGLTRLNEPPRGLPIMVHSGFTPTEAPAPSRLPSS